MSDRKGRKSLLQVLFWQGYHWTPVFWAIIILSPTSHCGESCWECGWTLVAENLGQNGLSGWGLVSSQGNSRETALITLNLTCGRVRMEVGHLSSCSWSLNSFCYCQPCYPSGSAVGKKHCDAVAHFLSGQFLSVLTDEER